MLAMPATSHAGMALLWFRGNVHIYLDFDVITDIVFTTPDWWIGVLRGKRGAFPASYIKLL